MTEPIHKGKDLPPVWVIHAASSGDSEAMEQVLRYYDDYMSRLCTRTLYEKDGTPSCVRGYPHETLPGNSTDPGCDARLILSALAEGNRLTLSSFADAGDCPHLDKESLRAA